MSADVSTATLFRRAAAAEWIRLRTLRSTWLALLAATTLLVFIGAAAGAGHSGDRPAPIWQPAQMALVPGQFAFLVVVLLAVTAEYPTGAIRSTLQWTPRRGVLFAARAVVPVVAVTAYAVIVAAGTALVARVFVGEAAEVDAGDIAASLGRVALVIGFGGLLTVGLGLLLRNTAATLTVLFLLMFALVITLGNSGVRWLITISDHLPGRAIVSFLVVDEVDLTPTKAATVIVGWTVVALSAAGWSLLRRDAT
jgi:hypothetical protein